MLVTEFEFELPKGYIDPQGNLHRKGVMRLATAAEEIYPLKDPRVQNWPAYLIIILLSRVVSKLGTLREINPGASASSKKGNATTDENVASPTMG